MPPDIEQDYATLLPLWEKLKGEVVYALEQAVNSNSIKIHQIESRVKNLESFIGKAYSNNYEDPLKEIKDIVGVRVVTLFQSSLSDVDKIIGKEFSILQKDDKTDGDDYALGYQSIHYLCTLRADYVGPRYSDISNHVFEIQARTLCMHAWAAVSHHLDYKGDWDVPKELKKSLQALSGLFHVADSQFEQFFLARDQYKLISKRKEDNTSTEINLETLYAYSLEKFQERRIPEKSEISKIVQEFISIGIGNIGDLNNIIDEALPKLLKIEENGYFSFGAAGALRISVGLSNKKYRDIKYNGRTQKELTESLTRMMFKKDPA